MKVGIVLMLEGNATSAPRYATLRSMARDAETAGFDALWLYDHLLFQQADGLVGQWESFSILAALAEATTQIQLGTLVTCTAFRNPAVTAKIATTIDEISGGRLTLGLGAGWNQAEFAAFGLPFDHRVSRFEEALKIIGPLVRTGTVDWQGAFLQAPGCHDLPRGPRPNGPPIMIGATRPRMLSLAAQHADSLNLGVNLDQPAETFERVAAACAEVGRDPATLPVSMPAWAAFPDVGPIPDHMGKAVFDSAEALAKYLHKIAAANVSEVMIDFRPNTPAALERVAAALRVYRG